MCVSHFGLEWFYGVSPTELGPNIYIVLKMLNFK